MPFLSLSWHVTGLVARECPNVMVVVCTRPLNASHMGALDTAVPAPYTEVHAGRGEYWWPNDGQRPQYFQSWFHDRTTEYTHIWVEYER